MNGFPMVPVFPKVFCASNTAKEEMRGISVEGDARSEPDVINVDGDAKLATGASDAQ